MDSSRSDEIEGQAALHDHSGDTNENNFNSGRSSAQEQHAQNAKIEFSNSMGQGRTVQGVSLPQRIQRMGDGQDHMYREGQASVSRQFYHRNELENQLHHQQMHSPMPSQYNNLVQKREDSASNKRYASSNGFKVSQNNFHSGQSQRPPAHRQQNKAPEQNCFQSQDNQGLALCHACSVNSKALTFTSLFSGNSIIYSQNVPISVHSGSQETQRQSTQSSIRYLRFEVEIMRAQLMKRQGSTATNGSSTNLHAPTPQTSHNGDVLHFSISDDSNPLFLYQTSIDVSKFQKLRREQNMFIEFSQFAEKIQTLLDFCVANGREDFDGSLNRFICVMNHLPLEGDDLDRAIIDIFEHNEFRHLLHLRLEFRQANHEETATWLSKKVLMQRKLNIDLQQENYELQEQHESDRLRINQIKQSLIALKATQNEELQRIKEDHEAQIDAAEEQKQRLIIEHENTYKAQIQDLTAEFDERFREIKQDADSLRDELLITQSNQKQQSKMLSDREGKIDELSSEIHDLTLEKDKLQGKLESLRDENNSLEKQLLEQKLYREQLQKDSEKYEVTIEQLRNQIQILEEQGQAQSGTTEKIKESELRLSEQNKYLENENLRLQDSLNGHLEKIQNLKDKKDLAKREIKTLIEEKSSFEGKNDQLLSQLDGIQVLVEKLQKELEGKERIISTLEAKLKDDQQTLISNKNMIEFLNKSLNEAQKFSFRTMVNQKVGIQQIEHHERNITPNSQSRFNTISPLRVGSAGIHVIETTKVTNDMCGLSSNKQLNNAKPLNYQGSIRVAQQPSNEAFMYRPDSSNFKLPLTEYYLGKTQNSNTFAPGTTNYHSFGNFNRPPVNAQVKQNYSASTRQFNHMLNNPFSTQLERERIISEEKLKQRFDEQYQSRYQGAQPNINLYAQNFNQEAQEQNNQVQYPEYQLGSRVASGKDLNAPLSMSNFQYKASSQPHSIDSSVIQYQRKTSKQHLIDVKFGEKQYIEVIDQSHIHEHHQDDRLGGLGFDEEGDEGTMNNE